MKTKTVKMLVILGFVLLLIWLVVGTRYLPPADASTHGLRAGAKQIIAEPPISCECTGCAEGMKRLAKRVTALERYQDRLTWAVLDESAQNDARATRQAIANAKLAGYVKTLRAVDRQLKRAQARAASLMNLIISAILRMGGEVV